MDEQAQGPPVHLVASDPPDGAGLDCDPADPACGVPTDVTLALRFDRFLLPETAIRQSMTMYTGASSNLVPPPSSTRPELTPQYDPLERTVRYLLPPGYRLHPNALYTVELPIYSEAQPFGFRAFDGAPLAGTSPTRLSFRTGAGPGAPLPAPTVPTCDQFQQLLHDKEKDGTFYGRCSELSCHGAIDHWSPSMGLLLSSAEGIRDTAIGRVAHQTETGDTTGLTNEAALRFGTNMPIIDPGRPENSYLVYKLLIGTAPYLPKEGDDCPVGARCEPPGLDEIARLRSWFVRGEPMPLATDFIDVADAQQIEAFIARGDGCRDQP